MIDKIQFCRSGRLDLPRLQFKKFLKGHVHEIVTRAVKLCGQQVETLHDFSIRAHGKGFGRHRYFTSGSP